MLINQQIITVSTDEINLSVNLKSSKTARFE